MERCPGETLRVALERSLREAILGGTLRTGVRLPGSRRLAAQLGVSRGVVTEAYEQLCAQGLLVTRGRSAPIVARAPVPSPAPLSSTPPPPHFDLTPWATAVDLFPRRRWLTTVQRVAGEAPSAILGDREHRGERVLRETLADHLGATRGVIADPEQIVVTQGTAQSLDLLMRVMRARGAWRVALEDPSPVEDRERIAACGLSAVARPVDEHGLRIAGIAADAVLVTPVHQCPTGAVLSAGRRRELLAWALGAGGLVIEHDYDSEFCFDGEPMRALQGLAPDRVVHVGSVAKTLAPAIRLGWVVAPTELVDEIARHKRLADGFSSPLDQLTLAAFLRSGDYYRHVRALRVRYRARRDRMLEALNRRVPGLAPEGTAAGVHLVLCLPPLSDDVEISQRARRAGIRVLPMSPFCIERTDLRGLVVGYGRLHEQAIDLVVRTLAATIAERSSGRPLSACAVGA